DNEPELTYPYEEVDPLNPLLPASESKSEDVIEVKDTVESKDETVPASVHEVGESSNAPFLREDSDGMVVMENLVKKLGNAEEKAECNKLKKELEEARFSNTLLRFLFEERPNEVIDVSVEDEKSPSSEPQGSPQSVDAAIAAERARHVNARGSRPVRGQDVAPVFRFNELALMCSRMVKTKSVKVDAYIRGLCENIKGKVTSSRPANLNEAVCMAHKLTKQNSQARDERNNQQQGNALAMTTALTEGKVSSGSLPLCECCFTRHTCYDYGEQGHTRNRCPKKVKQEEIGEFCGRAYAIKYVEPQGPNVVTGTFLLNNRYTSVLFDLGFDRSFMDTRFSSMLDINPVKIDASYEVELADGRVVSTNTILKGCTLNLVNHLFKIDLKPIEHGTFNVIIGRDWLLKHDVVINYGEKVVRIPYKNKMLTVKSNKGMSRLKVISCIKARKYIKRGCHLFLAHVTEKKPKEKQLEDVPVIRDFPEVFSDDLPGLHRQGK
nr:hypothetical protein [Tanacetum cinerariifolium]